ncbi:glycerophosphodiester phosphodiesterase family protein [Sporosarcina sp. Te-1]|uniref:glycerophosphodiester phosphodiesterase family protein n=1 Tax=Sporosarcina sp. Te-1 TaxID=2818390 RepID=UPI001A9CDECC|nr:glycerophosphodiester phosphodiesterase family protein [Sporosarcina sp. Te-1]QTD41106.1 hypothetical protein J3U78_20650 [Sporosarcina sp. Te-1]
MKKFFLISFLLFLAGCEQPAKPVPLPENNFLVIAHRGASAYAPEHTIGAYELAIQMRADYLELDLQQTKDGKLVVMHNRFIVNQQKEIAVADLTYEELKTLHEEGTGQRQTVLESAEKTNEGLISLEEVLERFGADVNYYIELKTPASYPGMEEDLIAELRDFGLLDGNQNPPRIILQSFDRKSLQRIHKLEPDIPLIQLYSFDKAPSFKESDFQKLNKYASGIGINKDVVSKELINQFHRHGLDIHPYTVNEEEVMRRLYEWGADGIFTDHPDIGVEVKREER